jgi:hypothetical protein
MHLGSPAVANVISSSVVILFVSNHSYDLGFCWVGRIQFRYGLLIENFRVNSSAA